VLLAALAVNYLSSGLYFYYLAGVPPGEIWSHANYAASSPHVKDYVVIVAMAKSEGQFLKEWVAHHKWIGVDHIVLYDDTPKGEKGAALPLLQEYVDTGFVEVHDATKWDDRSFLFNSDITVEQRVYSAWEQQFYFDKQQKMQIETWRRYQRMASPDHHIWLAQVDLDEMYNPKKGSLRELLQRVRMEGARSVRVTKLEFGPTGHLNPPEGDLRRNYILREAVGSKHTGLALVSAITGMASGCPHVFVTNSLILDLMRGSHECNNWHGEDYPGQIRYGVYYARKEELAMNHYQTKSMAECYERASLPHPDGKKIKRHCTDPKYNVCDDSILRHEFVDESPNLRLKKALKSDRTSKDTGPFVSRCSTERFRDELLEKAEELRLRVDERNVTVPRSE